MERNKNIYFKTRSARNKCFYQIPSIYLWGLSFYFLLFTFYEKDKVQSRTSSRYALSPASGAIAPLL
ncbi:MAG: hypothetical protein V7K67_06485, partial [Nostoc sp.]